MGGEEGKSSDLRVATGGNQAETEARGLRTCLESMVCNKKRVKAHATTFPGRWPFPRGESTEFCHTEREKKQDFYQSQLWESPCM